MTDLPRLALSIRQPWAWAIIHAGKDIENRTWGATLRGPICIHAARGCSHEEWEAASLFIHQLGHIPPMRDDMPFGGIVGVVDIVDSVSQSRSPWFFGPKGFALRNARPVDFIPVRGALGFFDWRKNLAVAA